MKQPCGLVKSADDPFAGPMRGFAVYLDRGNYTAIGATSATKKEGAKLTVMTVVSGASLEVAHKGDIGEFALGGGKVESLVLRTDVRPVASANVYAGVFTQWQLEYDLPEDKAAVFAKGPLQAWQGSVGAHKFQIKLSDDKRERIQNSLGCLFDGKPPTAR